jgi:hypothetical protein
MSTATVTSPSQIVAGSLEIWRSKVASNTITKEEMREVIRAIRGERKGASDRSEESRVKKAATKAAKAPIDGAALLAAFGGGEEV